MPVCPSCSFSIDANTKFCPWCDNPVDITYTTVKDSSGTVIAGTTQISALVKRYKDAYLKAKVIDGFGDLIKGVGMLVAGLLVVVGLILAANGRTGDATFALGIVAIFFGIFIGILFYLLGVLVSAQGQMLKASLDSTVNSSPFLTNEYRAKIMSLPEA